MIFVLTALYPSDSENGDGRPKSDSGPVKMTPVVSKRPGIIGRWMAAMVRNVSSALYKSSDSQVS